MKRLPIVLALAPLLGATDLLIKAVTLGLVGLLTLLLCGLGLMPLRNRLDAIQLALAALMIGALCVGIGDMLLQLLSAELADALSLSLALLVLPCLALAHQPSPGPWIGLRPGLALLGLALLLGSLRESLGQGSLLAHGDWLFGPAFTGWQLLTGLPLLTQAAGVFILLGVLLALLRHYTSEKAR